MPHAVEIPLAIFDDEGNQVDTTTVCLTADEIGSILDRAVAVVVAARRNPDELGMQCAGLEKELAETEVIDPDNLPPL